MTAELPLLWHYWVAGLTVIGLAFLACLVVRVYYPGDSDADADEDVVWDGDLTESAAVPPKWWFWLIIAALFYSVVYLMLYPGLGNYTGWFDLTTARQFSESQQRVAERYAAAQDELQAMSAAQLRDDDAAMRLGANLFAQHCANCHGADARGQAGHFPDLTDDHWQWGGAPAQVAQTIADGRVAQMPGWAAALGGADGVAAMARFVQHFDANRAEPRHRAAHAKYQQLCIACHGVDGDGNALLGAPSLRDRAWLYGGDLATLQATIADGRNGVMPAHKERLTALQIKLLTAWLGRAKQGGAK
ncbi:MAG: cytochrome-c oxidase, cbb3-type subunit III [bacterium]